MVRKVLYPAVFVLIMLAVGTAYAAWDFKSVFTLPGLGEFYDETGAALVQDGSYVQFIVGLQGSPIVDPAQHFGDLESADGAINTPGEAAAATTWLNAGADPAAISGGLNVLCYNTPMTFTGEFTTVGGAVNWDYLNPPWGPGNPAPVVANGLGWDLIGMRVWNVSQGDLEEFCTVPGVQVWYTTDREFGSQPNGDTGWMVGMGSVGPGEDPTAAGWGFQGTVGVEVATGAKPKNMTDVFLLECAPIPEPGTMLLIGSSVLLLLIRRKK